MPHANTENYIVNNLLDSSKEFVIDSFIQNDDVIKQSFNETSLLDDESLLNDYLQNDNDESMLSDDDRSFLELNNDVMSEREIELRKAYFSKPENQAEILFQNYMKEQQVRLNRTQQRAVKKQFIKNAKKGLYRKLFYEQIYGISYEEAKKKFQKLNN